MIKSVVKDGTLLENREMEHLRFLPFSQL